MWESFLLTLFFVTFAVVWVAKKALANDLVRGTVQSKATDAAVGFVGKLLGR